MIQSKVYTLISQGKIVRPKQLVITYSTLANITGLDRPKVTVYGFKYNETLPQVLVQNNFLPSSDCDRYTTMVHIISLQNCLDVSSIWWQVDNEENTIIHSMVLETDSKDLTHGTTALTGDPQCELGGYFRFSAYSEKVVAGSSINAGYQYAISFWFNARSNGLPTDDDLYLYRDGVNYLRLHYTGSVLISTGTTGVSEQTATGIVDFADNDWHHMLAISDNSQSGRGNKIDFYYDGVLIETTHVGGSTEANTNDITLTSLRLINTNATSHVDIDIRDFAVYVGAIAESDRTKIFSNLVDKVSTANLWWKCNEASGATAADSIGTNNGTITTSLPSIFYNPGEE